MEEVQPLLILSSRPWNIGLAERLETVLDRPVNAIHKPDQFTIEAVQQIDPAWIFVPHWSHLIPETIWGQWSTVIFHMTDLPYGRGGSPLQNLIQRGHTTTKLTALRCGSELDAGDIYLQEPLALHGTAEEIFLRTDALAEQMIIRIVKETPVPRRQEGKPVFFNRRTSEQSDLAQIPCNDLKAWYDQIRMLDAEEYPSAYLDYHGMRLEFRRVTRRAEGLFADVKITVIQPDC